MTLPKSSPNLRRYLYWSIGAAVATIVLKFAAYAVTQSVGLLSDALESFVNLFAAIFALYIFNVASKPADDDHAFGHNKAEYFSSAIEGALILVAAVSIIYSAAQRLMNPLPIENIGIGVLFALSASLINLFVGLMLIRNGKKHQSLILKADGHHLLTDVWTSVGVLIAILLVKLTGWLILDTIIAIGVAINIIFTGYKLLRQSTDGLMDKAISPADLDKITQHLTRALPKTTEYHSLQTRQAGRRLFVSFHLLVPGNWSVQQGHDLADKLECDIIALFDQPITVSTHLEPIEDPLSMEDIGIDREGEVTNDE